MKGVRAVDIYKAIIAIAKDLKPVKKSKDAQGMKTRSIDAVYNELQPLLAKHEVFNTCTIIKVETSSRTDRKGNPVNFAHVELQYTFFTLDGSSVVTAAAGEGLDYSDKAIGKAMSYAHKYAFCQLLTIPTADAPDSDNDSISAQTTSPKKKDDGFITAAQLKRLFAISKQHGFEGKEQIKTFVQNIVPVESLTEIPWAKYEFICKKISEGAPTKQT